MARVRYLVTSKPSGRFFQILWPSQNILTLNVNNCLDSFFHKLYIQGIEYLYMFANQSDPRIDELNCTNFYFTNDSNVLHPYRYTCFEQNPTFGYLTIGLTHAPGLLLSFFVCYGLREKVPRIQLSILILILTPLFLATFPVLLLLVKVCTLRCIRLFCFKLAPSVIANVHQNDYLICSNFGLVVTLG